MGRASLGLWQYCMYPLVPAYNNDPYPVCFEYDALLSTPGAAPGFAEGTNCTAPLTATGLERFHHWQFEAKREVIMWGIIGSIALVVIGDIYSEKLFLCCILNFAATGVGIFCMFMWVGFFEKLALDTDDRLRMGTSSLLLVAGWGGSAVTAVLYGKDWLCNAKHFLVVHKDGKEIARRHFDGSDVHKRDTKAEEDSSEEDSDSDDEVVISGKNIGLRTKTKGRKKKGKKRGGDDDDDDDDDDSD